MLPTVFGCVLATSDLSAPQGDDLAGSDNEAHRCDNNGDMKHAGLHGEHHGTGHSQGPQQVVEAAMRYPQAVNPEIDYCDDERVQQIGHEEGDTQTRESPPAVEDDVEHQIDDRAGYLGP